MRNKEVPDVLRLTVEFAADDQVAEDAERLYDFPVQGLSDVKAPSFDPLGSLEAPGGKLALAAIASAASPSDGVRFKDDGLDSMLFGQVDRARETSISRSNHDHVGVHIARDRTIIRRRLAGGRDPVGVRIILIATHARADQRIVARVVALLSAKKC